MDIVFNTDHYHRRIIDGTVLYGDEGDPSWTQLYIQGVLAECTLSIMDTGKVLPEVLRILEPGGIFLVMMGILLVDIRVMGAFGTAVSQTLQFVFVVGICMVSAVMVYALAYIARFTQDVRHILTNSVLMAIRHLPKTLLLVVVLVAAVLGCYLFGLGIVFIPAVAALVDSLILESIFVQYMSKEDREKEALRNHPEQYEYYNRKE